MKFVSNTRPTTKVNDAVRSENVERLVVGPDHLINGGWRNSTGHTIDWCICGTMVLVDLLTPNDLLMYPRTLLKNGQITLTYSVTF